MSSAPQDRPVLVDEGDSERMRRWRVVLIGVGILVLGIGVTVLVNDVAPANWIGIAVWLIGALILHDGIGALAVFGVAVLLRRTDRRIPFAVLAIVQGALVVAVIATLLFLPEALKQRIGTANPTILPLNYLLNLGIFYVLLAVLTAGAIAVYLRVRKRRQAADAS